MSHNHMLIANAASSIAGGDPFSRPPLPLSLEIKVEQSQTRDNELNHAVNKLIPAALEQRQGILIIQHDYGRYTVRVDPQVQCGTIQEYRV